MIEKRPAHNAWQKEPNVIVAKRSPWCRAARSRA
jgi:hypothetical protein